MTTSARYDEFADFYEQFATDRYDDPATSALLYLIGEVSGRRILDLACGHGRISRELARRGARVVGVDISSKLLDKARSLEDASPLRITYVHADATSPSVLAGERFHGVVCSFGLSDIDDLDGAIATVTRHLHLDSFFVFSILHPCFPGWEARDAEPSWAPERGYFEEGWRRTKSPANGLRSRVGANHRMLSTYLNTLASHGLTVEQVVEPLPQSSWVKDPGMGRIPIFLAARCRLL